VPAVTEQFVTKTVERIAPRSGQSRRNEAFGVSVNLDGRRVEFVFEWNGKHKFYSMNMMTPDGNLRKLYPRVGEIYTLRGFNPASESKRDAKVFLTHREGRLIEPDPKTLSDNYHINVLLGYHVVV
jgi:hypothetical protein